MKCAQVRERFSSHLDGELKGAGKAQFDRHVESCESCRARYRSFREALSALAELPRHPVPRSFTRAVMDGTREDTPARPVVPPRTGPAPAPRRGRGWGVAVLAAVFLIGVVVGLSFVVLVRGQLHRELRTTELAFRDLKRRVAEADERDDGRMAELLGSQEALRRTVAAHDAELAASAALEGSVASLKEELARERRAWKRETRALASRLEGEEERRKSLASGVRELLRAQEERWSARLTALERSYWSAQAVAPEAAAPAPAPGPEAAIEHYYEDGMLVWSPKRDHPGFIAELFRIYDSGDRALKRRALAELDAIFSAATADRLDREPRTPLGGIVGELFGNEETGELADREDAEQERVEIYREYWLQHVRSESTNE